MAATGTAASQLFAENREVVPYRWYVCNTTSGSVKTISHSPAVYVTGQCSIRGCVYGTRKGSGSVAHGNDGSGTGLVRNAIPMNTHPVSSV